MKKDFDVCNILGVNIAAVNMEYTVNYIVNNLLSIKGKYICVSNVHTTVMSYEDKTYCTVQNESVMALPDGKPLSVVAQKRGYSDVERVTGPDLMGEIFAISAKHGYKHYFYGSTENTLQTLKSELEKKYSGIQIVGMYSPPFRELSEEEDKSVVDRINVAQADFVWVGLGAPKQEVWMWKHKDKINGLMIGVGAGFDYYAGNIKRAPGWMQKVSLEWLYRLLQDPKRLFKRYLITNTKFLWLVGKQK